MATITFFNPVYAGPDVADGYVTEATSTRITVDLPSSSVVDTYIGNFVYGVDGSLAGGVLSEVDESYRNLLSFQITNLALPATVVANAVLNGDSVTLANALFSGDDQITGSIYAEAIGGGPGNDTIIALDGNDTVFGGAGNDDVNGNVGDDSVSGGDGNDMVRGGKGNDSVYGDAGDDPHVNGNLGDDIVHGGAGNDTVYGGQGNDTVYGDEGNDRISGDLGNDILYGGPGADTFVFARGGGVDWIADFSAAQGDHIELPAGTAYTLISFDGQAMLDLGNGDHLGLAGVPFAAFNAGWVTFA